MQDRAAVFLRAAELLTTTWRATLNAATMLGQSKTVFQAEIDSASELIDFWRFNPHFAQELYAEQPISSHATWNQMEYRPLEGFVYAVTPFNFTSIAGNLPTAPALMGNTVVWKPASSAMLSAHYILRLLEAAGLPPGVINLVSGDAAQISSILLDSPDLAGVHFTGSTAVFNSMWTRIGANIGRYRSYPRLVGETGGKDFIVAHPSADAQELAVAIARGAFEYQGQKCSAASRVYVPQSLWPEVRDRVVAMMREMTLGDVADFRTFMGAVIDRKSFTKISGYLEDARTNANIIQGGGARDEVGYFIEPTLVETKDPAYRLMCEEIFGPVLTAYAYPDAQWEATLEIVDRTSPYALTGAVFATGSRRGAAGVACPAQRRRQLLRERQAHWRGRRPAAVRRRARVGHQRQGRLEDESAALGERAGDQGDVLASRATSAIRTCPKSRAGSSRTGQARPKDVPYGAIFASAAVTASISFLRSSFDPAPFWYACQPSSACCSVVRASCRERRSIRCVGPGRRARDRGRPSPPATASDRADRQGDSRRPRCSGGRPGSPRQWRHDRGGSDPVVGGMPA